MLDRALILVISVAIPVTGFGQTFDSLDVTGKLQFHAENTYGPSSIVRAAVNAAILQQRDAPEEWGQGAGAYGKRFASTLARSGIHNALAFGLDSTLHQDPRYYRAGGTGFGRRVGHAFRGTILTRTDSGGETLSTWRLGSAYGAAFLANQWYPDRVNTVGIALTQGTVTLAFELAKNVGLEFWPDIKRKVLRRK